MTNENLGLIKPNGETRFFTATEVALLNDALNVEITLVENEVNLTYDGQVLNGTKIHHYEEIRDDFLGIAFSSCKFYVTTEKVFSEYFHNVKCEIVINHVSEMVSDMVFKFLITQKT